MKHAGTIALIAFGLVIAGIVVREQRKEQMASLICPPEAARIVLRDGTIGCPISLTDEAKK
ncbi:hypothetical protein D3C87_838930 [compost metagenome]